MRYTSETVSQFLAQVASPQVAPAGGTCAAVVGATGASLGEMACIHTLDDPSSKERAAELRPVREQLARKRAQLLQLGESDAEVVENHFTGGGDPGALSKRATGIPLTISRACLDVIESGQVVTRESNENVRPDAYSGMIFATSALQAAIYTVRMNIEHVEDPGFHRQMARRADDIESAAREVMDSIHDRMGS